MTQNVSSMRTPRSLDVEITARCNLRCRYCYFFDNPGVEYRDLPTEAWLRFFDECGRCALMEITLAGGEPFLREDLPELLQGIVRNRMRFSILSNGTRITEDMAAMLAETNRCTTVQISIDGSKAEVHDACRGEGAFDAAIRGIRTLQRHSVPLTVRVTIHRHNVHDLENIAVLLLEELQLPGFSTNAAGYLGACRQYAGDVLLSMSDRHSAMTILESVSEMYPHRISAMAGPLADARRWRRMEDARRQALPAFPNGGRLTGCGCSETKMTVRADGVMVPCSLLPPIELGRINQDALEDVWQQSAALNRLRRRDSMSLTGFAWCAGCPYIPYCTGNCPGLAYSLTGQVDHPSPDACLREYLTAGGKLPE